MQHPRHFVNMHNMSMEVYANSGRARKDHTNTEVIFISDTIYANAEALKSKTKDEAGQQAPGGPREVKSSCRATAKCLGLLCVLLLSGIIGLSVYYITVVISHRSEMQNLRITYENLTAAQKQLQTDYNILTEERDQLQSRYDNVSASRDALQLEVNCLKLTENCPQDWKKFGCSCYYISSERKTWEKSREDCVSKRGHLVIINSRDEQAFLSNLADRSWIGLSDIENEGQWKWVDGSPLEDEGFWGRGEPNNASGGEDCVELFHEKSEWNDLPCSRRQQWICEN